MISSMQALAVIIPAYNEELSIAHVVHKINALKIEDLSIIPIVVNDCSTDQTAIVASQVPCILLNLPINLGIGGAVQTGFRYARSKGFDFAMQVDGDGQHPASAIPAMVETLRTLDCDVVIGSRFITGRGYQSTPMRRAGIGYFGKLIRFLCGIKVTDSTSGFRIVNRKTIEIACDYYPDEYPEPESIILYHLNSLAIREIPVEMASRSMGKSSIRFFLTLYYMVKVSLAILYTFVRVKLAVRRQGWKT